MEVKSIFMALVLLAVLFGWYAWLEAGERRRRRVGDRRGRFGGTGEGGGGRAGEDDKL
ncbi:MAG TPA: hypothetical protein VGX48_10635 [Pyrinomonadaceae bacterium]|jgi:hypothetical protein|nr:hypothetical protein [Pyrinomonadaceae bacterium]